MPNKTDFDLTRLESVIEGRTFAGLHYTTELSGPNGVHVFLFPFPQRTSQDVMAAKSAAQNERDVVGFSIVRIEPEDLLPPFVPRATPAETGWLKAAQHIAAHGAQRVWIPTGELVPDDRLGGERLCRDGAKTLLNFYAALNDVNKIKYIQLDILQALTLAFEWAEEAETPC